MIRHHEPHSEQDAMQRLQSGDDLALNEIMDRWQIPLVRFLLRLTGNESTATDLAQESFVRVYQHRHHYRPKGAFSTWLFTIATNLARQHFRWLRRHPAISLDHSQTSEDDTQPKDNLPSEHAGPDETILAAERAAAVRTAIAALPEDLREIVVLAEYENLSHAEIGKITTRSPKAVEMRLYRARAALRKRLKAWLNES